MKASLLLPPKLQVVDALVLHIPTTCIVQAVGSSPVGSGSSATLLTGSNIVKIVTSISRRPLLQIPAALP